MMSVEKNWFKHWFHHVSSCFIIGFKPGNHWSLRTCGGIYWTYFASSSAWSILLLNS